MWDLLFKFRCFLLFDGFTVSSSGEFKWFSSMNNDFVEEFIDYLCCLVYPFLGDVIVKGVINPFSIDLKGFKAKKFFNTLD